MGEVIEKARLLWFAWAYFAELTLSKNPTNKFLYELPSEIQEALLTVGQWLMGLLTQ